jgi:hypothetical protein
MSNKTFKYVGISTLNGVRKLRYANDNMRIKVLERNGHKDVELIELPKAMTKAEIEAGDYTKQFNLGVKNEKVRALADKAKIGASAKTETVSTDAVTE